MTTANDTIRLTMTRGELRNILGALSGTAGDPAEFTAAADKLDAAVVAEPHVERHTVDLDPKAREQIEAARTRVDRSATELDLGNRRGTAARRERTVVALQEARQALNLVLALDAQADVAAVPVLDLGDPFAEYAEARHDYANDPQR